MTIEYPYTLAQLARILSALENERRNPNTKRNAIKSIERAAAQLDLTADDVFDAADGLLSGRQSAAEFRAALRDEPSVEPATSVIERPVEPAVQGAGDEPAQNEDNDEPEESKIADPLAVKPSRAAPRTGTKQALMIEMLSRAGGATIDQIAAATGWQRHTCRGAISGGLKKKLGLTITTGKIEGRGTVYHLED